LGRISFYINKCYRDLLLIDNPINSEIKSSEYFTEMGLQIYSELKNKWKEMYRKWFEVTKHYDMSNQPYNFTYSNFAELNPLKN
jgi:DNA gyrase inhibitor GyrI